MKFHEFSFNKWKNFSTKKKKNAQLRMDLMNHSQMEF
jgi:hypothetical protein